MGWVAKISPPGVNVLTATDAQLILNSDKFGSMKIATTYTLSVVYAGGASRATTTQAHGLGYVPAFFGIVTSTNGADSGKYYSVPTILGDTDIYAKVYANSTNIVATVGTNDPGAAGLTATFKVVVFKEKVA